jgi:hypothetical protein
VHCLVKLGQVVKAGRRDRMFWPKNLLVDLESLLEEGFGSPTIQQQLEMLQSDPSAAEIADLKLRGLREDGPYFNGLTVLKARVAFRDLYRFFKAVCVNEPVACDRFLGFRQRSVRYPFSARKNLAFQARADARFSFFPHRSIVRTRRRIVSRHFVILPERGCFTRVGLPPSADH